MTADQTNEPTVDGPIDSSTIDRLLESVGGDESFLDELTEAYLADAPVHLAAIRRALDAGSADELVRPAHTLKSSSATVGALILSGYARELELDARGGSVAGGDERLAAAEAEFGRATQELGELRTARWRTTKG
ncbi:MAG: Hpt domain-containing protein [Candidatus Limnocylindrales bacterium]